MTPALSRVFQLIESHLHIDPLTHKTLISIIRDLSAEELLCREPSTNKNFVEVAFIHFDERIIRPIFNLLSLPEYRLIASLLIKDINLKDIISLKTDIAKNVVILKPNLAQQTIMLCALDTAHQSPTSRLFVKEAIQQKKAEYACIPLPHQSHQFPSILYESMRNRDYISLSAIASFIPNARLRIGAPAHFITELLDDTQLPDYRRLALIDVLTRELNLPITQSILNRLSSDGFLQAYAKNTVDYLTCMSNKRETNAKCTVTDILYRQSIARPLITDDDRHRFRVSLHELQYLAAASVDLRSVIENNHLDVIPMEYLECLVQQFDHDRNRYTYLQNQQNLINFQNTVVQLRKNSCQAFPSLGLFLLVLLFDEPELGIISSYSLLFLTILIFFASYGLTSAYKSDFSQKSFPLNEFTQLSIALPASEPVYFALNNYLHQTSEEQTERSPEADELDDDFSWDEEGQQLRPLLS